MSSPIFVLGSMGSGTTLLRLMLDSHPQIAIAQETGFLRAAMATYYIPFWRFGGQWLDRIGLTEEEFDRHVEAFYDGVFGEAAAKRGASRWGDKTPYHVHHMALAARVFPDARFVATVRHPGGVANSVKRFNWDWDKGLQHWIQSNQVMVDQAMTLGDRIHLLRYEDLVREPERAMREVLQFVGEDWNDSVLAHHEVQGGGRAEGGTMRSDPIDQARMSKWLTAASSADLARLATVTGSLARVLGYAPDDALPVSPLSDASVGIDGSQLVKLYAQAEPVDRVKVPAAFENRPFTMDSMARELRAAYLAGRDGGHVRAAYRAKAEAGLAKPSASFVARARRRIAKVIEP